MSVRRNTKNGFVAFESIESRTLMSGSLSSVALINGPILSPPTVTRPVSNSGPGSSSSSTSSPRLDWRKSGDKSPIFDFKDTYYLSNGIDPTKIAGRPNGTGGSVIDNRVQDPTRRNVRVKTAVGFYDEGGDPQFFSVLGLINANAFTNNSAGKTARQIADKYIAYVFPKASAGPLSLNKRQDDVIPLNNGYFSNNPLGVWRMKFVNYVPGSMNSGEGKEVADELRARNGVDADGTPFIRSINELEDAVDAGIVTVTTRNNDGSQGQPWFFCPVYKDSRNGALTSDSTLAVVRNPDGTVHASSKPIEALYNANKSSIV